jgi:hypothetical protein
MRNFLTDSRPDLSTDTSPPTTSEATSEDSIIVTPLPAYHVYYGGRTEHVYYDPQWSIDEIHRRARTIPGVPEGNATSLKWQNLCAQSDTEPQFILANIWPEKAQQLAQQGTSVLIAEGRPRQEEAAAAKAPSSFPADNEDV